MSKATGCGMRRAVIALACAVGLLGAPGAGFAQNGAPAQARKTPRAATDADVSSAEAKDALRRAHARYQGVKSGKNADYIPSLAKVDPNLFGIVLVTVDGRVFSVGDAEHPFAIESVSKPFTLARVLQDVGADTVEKKIGTNATGEPFNSIIAIEQNHEAKRPPAGNPLVNAGAITAVSMVPAQDADARWTRIEDTLNAFAGRELDVNEPVYHSESATNTRNRAISWLLKSYDALPGDPMEALDVYTRQCSVNVTAKDLAIMGATLANGGTNPVTGKRVVDSDNAQKVLSLMLTTGLYENSGDWSFTAGLPAKSGVGGGIVAVVPGRFAVATFSPPLDKAGNSVRGQKAVESIITELGGDLFSATGPKQAAPSGAGVSGSR
ncbi:glutaminase A [Corallococcus sp. Z5C101001]|uniref:glutaminase A n=1 Tax=Corallococcus sp. Z5C101001 TaxID=2596829 RepID=UPI00117EA397|nr:glutaminase A [Corallococcus sp. Z5C101001]TSC32401.1 glutaminase A [Corallococcus sp. Z5C101001]